MWHGSRSLSHLREHLTARTGDGHAPPLSSSGKIFNLAFILLSLPVRFPALTPIKPQASRLVVLPRQFLQVSILRSYIPGGMLNGFPAALGWLVANPTPSMHRLRLGLPGYLIRFATPAFVPDRQTCSSQQPSPLVVLRGSKDFAPTPRIPLTSPTL